MDVDRPPPPGYYFSVNVVTQTDEDDQVLVEVLVIVLHQRDASIAGQITIPLRGLPNLMSVLQRVLDKFPDRAEILPPPDRKVH